MDGMTTEERTPYFPELSAPFISDGTVTADLTIVNAQKFRQGEPLEVCFVSIVCLIPFTLSYRDRFALSHLAGCVTFDRSTLTC